MTSIIEDLNNYYVANKTEKDLGTGNNIFPSYGYAEQKIAYKISLDKNGDFESFDTVDQKIFLPDVVVLDQIRCGKKMVPSYFYDNEKYILGCSLKKNSLLEYAYIENLTAFIEHHKKIFDITKNKDLEAVIKFSNSILDKNINPKNWDIITTLLKNSKIGGNIIFSIDGRLLHEQKDLDKYWKKEIDSYKGFYGMCMITGKKQSLKRLHGKIKNIRGGNTEKTLISFNSEEHKSYTRENAPCVSIGSEVEYGYRTALNYFTASDINKSEIGSDTLVYWVESHKDNIFCKIFKVFARADRNVC